MGDDGCDYFAALPDDILMEILARLPVESLMKFKCVSKHWFSTITDPFFADLFVSRSSVRRPHGDLLLLRSYHHVVLGDDIAYHVLDPNLQKLTLHKSPLLSRWIGFAATNMVNGLICFYDSLYGDNQVLCVYNFTTCEILDLPEAPLALHRKCYLGFDRATDKYKVVSMFSPRRKNAYSQAECRVLTVGDNVWRPIDTLGISRLRSMFQFWDEEPGVYIDGVIYQMLKDYSLVNNKGGVLGFDFEFEIFLELVNYPGDVDIQQGSISLCQVGGCVCLVQLPWQCSSDSDIVLWKLMTGKDMPLWNKQVLPFPFVEAPMKGRIRCSDFGLLSFVRTSKDASDVAVVDCYDLAAGTRKQLQLVVNNARGLLYGRIAFLPSVLVENILPLTKI